ncbi:hypothetical protein EK21DRAFT_117479 [Setomelanomma holmii]|uniref:Uncharacterized protein n=1 Tax=Setomelanomma holmii TaxID=210430 RepID=A0A9P4H082_9PLEO|nr:hypothetical protein EK21DRAFT_117479 [Setomelanomma holmii]
MGALKKALLNELENTVEESLMPPPLQKSRARLHRLYKAEDCLHHILCCWNVNLKRYDAAGPSFLVHILRGSYGDPLTFADLVGEDKKTAWALRRAAPKRSFRILLGRMRRVAEGAFQRLSNGTTESQAHSTKCTFQDLVHVGVKDVHIQPHLSEDDLVDQNYFENVWPDRYDEGRIATWIRTILVIVPNDFIDDFINEEEAVHESVDDGTAQANLDHHANTYDDDLVEEEFEYKDEEAILERAHELSQRRLALEGGNDQDDSDSDVEVEDENGNSHMMPASMFVD